MLPIQDESSLWLWSYGSLQLPDQSVPITTKGVSSNHVHGEVYSIQHYVTKFVSDLRQISGFHRELRCSGRVSSSCFLSDYLCVTIKQVW